MRLAYEHNKLLRPPIIHKLKEGAPRQGFFEREQFETVRRHLPPDLQVAVTIAYTFGWRMQSEVLTLSCDSIILRRGHFALNRGRPKTMKVEKFISP